MKNIFLLDADETLLDFPADEKKGLITALVRHGIAPSEEIYHRFHEINKGLWKRLERREITRERLVVKRFEILFAEHNIQLDAEQFCAEYFDTLVEGGILYEGANEFLRALKERGRVFIVTNGSSNVQHDRLKNAGVTPLVDGLFISEEVGVYKPSQEYANYVEEHIQDYERKNAVWIGDSLTSDCACANSAGIDFILYAPKGAPQDYGGLYAKDYGEILRILDNLE